MSVFNVLPSFSGASNIEKQGSASNISKLLLGQASTTHHKNCLSGAGNSTWPRCTFGGCAKGWDWPGRMIWVNWVLRIYLESAEQHFGQSVDVANVEIIFSQAGDIWYIMISPQAALICTFPHFVKSFSRHGLHISHGHLHGLCGRSHGCTPAWCSRICRWNLFPSNWMDRSTQKV